MRCLQVSSSKNAESLLRGAPVRPPRPPHPQPGYRAPWTLCFCLQDCVPAVNLDPADFEFILLL